MNELRRTVRFEVLDEREKLQIGVGLPLVAKMMPDGRWKVRPTDDMISRSDDWIGHGESLTGAILDFLRARLSVERETTT